MHEDFYNLQRFIDAQKTSYVTALSEITRGKKRSHWMWYIFPQVQGLGFSDTSRFYAIENLAVAEAYLKHPLLGNRLVTISKALLALNSSVSQVFGSPDDAKLRSSMTLFAQVENADPVFGSVLQKFFNGLADDKTLRLLKNM